MNTSEVYQGRQYRYRVKERVERHQKPLSIGLLTRKSGPAPKLEVIDEEKGEEMKVETTEILWRTT
jgi:hypothetical protein